MAQINTAKLYRSHIKIADNGGFPDSTYNDTFVQHSIDEARAYISYEKMNDLRRSHFTLAYADGARTETTETRAQYVPHPSAQRKASVNLHGIRDNISGKLGYDEPVVESCYMADYSRNMDDAKRAPQTKNLQYSHFALGDDAVAYKSEYYTVYAPRSSTDKPAQQAMNLRQSHLPVDEGNREYTTEFSANFQPIEVQSRETYDLRRFQHSHVQLTDGISSEALSTTQYALSETATLGRLNINDAKQKERERFLRESHIPVAESNAFYGKSETRSAFPGRDNLKAAETWKPKSENTQEHVCYPEKEYPRASEMRANYVYIDNQEQVDKNRKEAETIRKFMGRPTDPNCQKLATDVGDGRSVMMVEFYNNAYMIDQVQEDKKEFHLEAKAHGKSSIQIADKEANNVYTTQTRAMLDGSAQYCGKRLTAPINNQLWRSDVMLKSGYKDSYETENKAAFVPGAHGVSEMVNQDMINQLRRSHFYLGDDEPDYKSVARTDIVGHDDYKDDGKYVGYTDKYDEQMFLM